jgi:hypothetical protein
MLLEGTERILELSIFECGNDVSAGELRRKDTPRHVSRE